MLRSTLVLIALLAGPTATAQNGVVPEASTAHIVPFGQAGNAVELVLAAERAYPLSAYVRISESPEWVTVRPEGIRVSAEAGQEAVAAFAFDVSGTAPAGEPGMLAFVVETEDGRWAEHRIEVEAAAPLQFSLGAPRPNPARGRVTFPVALPEAGRLVVEAYDVLGRSVAVLHDGAVEAGGVPVTMEAGRLAPGLYVVRATARAEGERTRTDVQRLTVVR